MSDRVLAFGCHPDDVEFMAAGTLALLARAGWEVHIATMTGGEVGSAKHRSPEIREIRLKEAEAAAKVLGGYFHWAGGCDLQVEYNEFYRRAATRIVREVDPAIILAPPPLDYLIDHEETSRLVRNAAYVAPVPLYDCGAPLPPTRRHAYLYYWNAIDGVDIFGRALPIRMGVDVTSVMDVKETMLRCHASQREWLLYLNGWDAYVDNMKEMTRRQGQRIGRAWGEGFIQHLGCGHPRDNILKAILGDACVELD